MPGPTPGRQTQRATERDMTMIEAGTIPGYVAGTWTIDPVHSGVTAEIDLSSIDTGAEQRDAHLRSPDFFDTENHPLMTYRSTGIHYDGDKYLVDGELTLKGVTKSVPLTLEVNGFGPDAYGGTRAGFTATAEINRQDFGVSWNAAMEAGGVVVSD